ncbi:cilia- and flagella-associated protein 157-like [Anneissia japonica]|uniref:cilia- and flagella-associated protein 157-like n=1 Tax=Anneissia japonica TaxID=1529436 RepID=UPI001425560B|nr:cilia- and flagella-associated protein 157-like [Anneissia japonica]
MPPKKKGKKKGKKSGKKSGRKSARANSAPSGLNLTEVSKEFFLIQIRDLENRLARYQRKCDELEVASSQFQAEYGQMSTDKKEIVSFLKKQLEQRQDEIADLNDRLVGLQQAKDAEKDGYEQQLTQLRTEFQETKDQLTSENMILSGKLASLEEFKVQKEDLMAKFAAMEVELERQQTGHNDKIYQLERKQVVDKDRLKREMVLRVNQVASEFRKVSNKQMADTTKRTIRENVSINAQLAKMSDKTMELIQENDELRAKEKKQRQQIDMLEANEKELAKKNHSNQKVIRMLTEKAKGQESLIIEHEEQEKEYLDLETEAQLLRKQAESSREELQAMGKEMEHLEEDLEMTKKQHIETKKNKENIERILSEAAYSLHRILMMKGSGDDVLTEDDSEGIEQRDSMLENLLIILNEAAVIGVGPSPGEFIKEEAPTYRTKSCGSSFPGSRAGLKQRSFPLTPVSRAINSLPHYKIGDLGLVPRPKPKFYGSDKTRQLSATSRLNRLQGVKSRSVGVQAADADSKLGSISSQFPLVASKSSKSAIFHEIAVTRPPLGPIMTKGKFVR